MISRLLGLRNKRPTPPITRAMRADEYKRLAEEAEAAARAAKSELDRDEFLRVAQAWRALAAQVERDLKRGL